MFLISDAYSHKIIGYYLQHFLANDGALLALEMALKNRTRHENQLIHHSDRGVQYFSFDYVRNLIENKIAISMTQNRIKLNKHFKTRSDATSAVNKPLKHMI